VQTYGYGTRLGYLKVQLQDGKVNNANGELLKVWSDQYVPDEGVLEKINAYKNKAASKIGQPLGILKTRLVRDYQRESSLGCFIADVIREAGKADIGFENAGGIRADIPAGTVTNGNVLDAVPFFNNLSILEMTGKQIKEVLEQSFSLDRGMMQVSGLTAWYDMERPIGQRLVKLNIGKEPSSDEKIYKVATNSFIADGGDLYSTFHDLKKTNSATPFSSLVIDYIKANKVIDEPQMGRLIPVKK
jgi:2',3'-cyclic-nucleotide 2'-phosphodiesterase (5'-nucleotidase family)